YAAAEARFVYAAEGDEFSLAVLYLLFLFFFKQKTAYEIGLGIPAEPLFRSSIFIPKLRLILILNSFLGSSDSLVFSELFHSLAPRPLAARSISDFLLTYLAT